MSKLFEQLLEIRGFDENFLHPRYQDLSDPFIFPDMREAVARIKKAVRTHEKVLIYGDYDVDGVTASTALADVLTLSGLPLENLDIMLPDRFRDGYGMSPRLIGRAKEQGVSLVITVDCGSQNHAIIEELKRLNIDTIVTDHHECGETLPDAVAVINPKRPDFPAAARFLRDLAGVGVVFKLAEALVKQGIIPVGQEKWLLDLVLIGTICDNMPLTGENRILGFYGTIVLQKTRRPGLLELISRAEVKNFTADSIGYQIGPRLNAAGRLESAHLSLELLRTKSRTKAAKLAEKLEILNKKRKNEQQSALAEIASRGPGDDPVIIETGSYHEGVLGIIAGHLVETYHRPAFVLSRVENGLYKGSARSFGDFNLAKALDFAKNTLVKGGGHAAAAGLTLEGKNLYAFREQINQYYRDLKLPDQTHFLRQHADLTVSNLADFSLDLLDELKLLEPFGAGNTKPIFRLQGARVLRSARIGADRNHLRLDLCDQAGHQFKLLAFFAPEAWFTITPEDQIEPLIHLEQNYFQGVTSVEGTIVDIDFLHSGTM